MKDTDQQRLKRNIEILAMSKIEMVSGFIMDGPIIMHPLKSKYLLEGAWPKSHKSASSNSGGVGRAGRRAKRFGRRH